MRQRHGFSLIELLVVLAVLSVVTTVGTTMFFKINDLWRATSVRGQLEDRVGNTDDQLSRDFGMVLSSTLSGVGLQGIRRVTTIPQGDKLSLSIEDDWFAIPVEEVNLLTGKPERHNAIYRVHRSDENEKSIAGTLGRAVLGLGEPIPDTPENIEAMEVAAGVLEMRGEYFDGENWRETWSGNGMPEAVRVSLTLVDEARPWEQVSRVLTYPIHVK